jgi:alpha-mannosidase
MQSVHLICNAHLDPVWLWEWEEGAAEAMGTFRAAADLCEQFDGFVFNHNEAILYRWVEEYEPALFKRIQGLVRRGKWHIMGGWYLQPDCNMPSGEGFVRQILLGREYFRDRFGACPRVAINFDPFGHSRGLVQILAGSGYRGYLFCRPRRQDCPLPADCFVWEGYDGSRVLAVRSTVGMYDSPLGGARRKVERLVPRLPAGLPGVILWGVGNHGGGPSRRDLRDLAALIRQRRDLDLRHSTPEAAFAELARKRAGLPVHRRDLNPWAVGCYTSQIRVKQRYRLLENTLFSTEKMVAAAWGQKAMPYPAADLREAARDMATAQFHDILPGSSIQPAEEAALRMMDHGLEKLARVRARAFFALAGGQPRARDGEIPVFVHNPHPFPVDALVECEFNLADHNRSGNFTAVTAFAGGRALATQVEQELSSIPIDWRKRVVFRAQLAPSQMNRFDCRTELRARRPRPRLRARGGKIRFRTGELEAIIDARTGLMERYRVGGVDCLSARACLPLSVPDTCDSWGMTFRAYSRRARGFRPLSATASARFAGVAARRLPPVRVIEDGPARAVVEVLLGCADSRICMRYKLPRKGTEVELELRVHWNEKDRLLKLSLPVPDGGARVRGQVACGADELPANGEEFVAQKWLAVVSARGRRALTVINDGTYGADFRGGQLRLSLLRSPGYSAHPVGDRPVLPADRYSPRSDQGERTFRLWLNAGPARARLAAIDRESLVHNERPMTLSFFPAGGGMRPKPLVTLSGGVVQLVAAKKAERGNALILRLFEPTGRARTTTVSLPLARMRRTVRLRGFELRTYRVDLARRSWAEVDLTEARVR